MLHLHPSDKEIVQLLEKFGFTQDPDVLDTWFSSWLWPFATMGWPEKTETLKKFYPTTDLVTGPDIIFFWVARMIMAGYEFTGEMPFRNVYFTGIIRDKQGRKMSKSLGNSPDPLDLIAQYGADALRFGVMRSAPLGQDVLYDEQQVELGRNFCNKLWNACRFRQMQAGASRGRNPARASDQRRQVDFAQTGPGHRRIERRAGRIQIQRGGADPLSLFLERVLRLVCRGRQSRARPPPTRGTPTPRAPGQHAGGDGFCAVAHIAAVPSVPALHHRGAVARAGLSPDMPADQGGETIMFAPWPKPLDEDFRAHYGLDGAFPEGSGRPERIGHPGPQFAPAAGIPGNKKVKYIFKPAGRPGPHDLAAMKLLLNAESLEARDDFAPARGTPAARSELGELYLPLEGAWTWRRKKNA